ncbi:hypothetical protein BDR07DRAFT_1309391, partial [Suillus spraguei]
KLTSSFPKWLTGLYMALCTQHVPLHKHLHRIGKSPSPYCQHCPGVEKTVPHFLLDCPHYRRAQHTLASTFG